METGSHDPARVVCVEGHAGCLEHTSMPRQRTEADNMAMRGEVPPGWVRLPGGGIVPPNLAARMSGWGDDRDTINVTKITEARTAMAEAVTAYHVAYGHMLAGEDMVALMVAVIAKADAMAEAWHKFTEATGGDR